jgi:hypothetical protein
MSFFALVLTRCPIHARRFHRFSLRPNRHGKMFVTMLRGGTCCPHLRTRKLRIRQRPASVQ